MRHFTTLKSKFNKRGCAEVARSQAACRQHALLSDTRRLQILSPIRNNINTLHRTHRIVTSAKSKDQQLQAIMQAREHGTKEQQLLSHVQNTVPAGSPKAVLEAIDKYGWNQEWFMNVGDVKGAIVDNALASVQPPPKVALELGAYCGYSAVRISSQLTDPDAKLYSVDVNPTFMAVARAMVVHAGLQDRVEFVQGPLEQTLQGFKARGVNSFDFVFIDHDKSVYLKDLLLLQNHSFLHPGTLVVADNLVYPGAPDYIEYMKAGPGSKAFDTVFHKTTVEYSPDIEDLVGVSRYLGEA